MMELISKPTNREHVEPQSRLGRPARVCFLIDNLSRAGTETQLLALLKNFDRNLVEPHLVLLDGENDESQALEPDTCPVVRLGVKSFASRHAYSAARKFRRYLRHNKIDILQTYFLDSIYFGVPVARWARVKRVVRVRNNLGYWLNRKHRLLGGLYSPWIDRTITNSDQGRQALEAEGVSSERIAVLENGVDVERFDCHPPSFEGEIKIGAVANLRPVKGLDVLIRSAAILLKRYPNLRFEIAGEGEQRSELQQLIRDLNIGERFQLVGSISDIPVFLASLDVAVLSSRSEGMSNALLEYMASGRAIVATRVGANDRLIRDRLDGVLIKPDNPLELANAIEWYVIDPEFGRELGGSARRRAISTFSRSAMRRRFENFYQELLAD